MYVGIFAFCPFHAPLYFGESIKLRLSVGQTGKLLPRRPFK